VRENWRVVGTLFVGNEVINAAGAETQNRGFYGLVDYNFTENLGAYVRYDQVDPNTAIDKNDSAMFLVGISGLLFQNDKNGARWQIEFTSKTSYDGGNIKTAGTTKYRDNRIWFQATFGF